MSGRGDTLAINIVASCSKRCKGEFSDASARYFKRYAKQVESLRGVPNVNVDDIFSGNVRYTCLYGQYSNVVTEECELCPVGTYWDDVELSWRCKKCPEGHFASLPGQMFCRPCPIGHESSSDGASCVPCAQNYYNDQIGGVCKKCGKGYFTNYSEGSTACMYKCDEGMAHIPETGQVCSPCPAGQKPFTPDAGPPICISTSRFILEGLKDYTLF